MSGQQGTGSVKSKAAFFDAWVKSNMKVDPQVIRQQAKPPVAAQANTYETPLPANTYETSLSTNTYETSLPTSNYDPIMPIGKEAAEKTPETSNYDPVLPSTYFTPNQQDRSPAQPSVDADGSAADADIYFSQPDMDLAPEAEHVQPGPAASDPGLTPLPLGDKYKGEEQGAGWQAGRKRDGRQFKTKYFNEAERADSAVEFSADGSVSTPGGQSLEGEKGFVMDPGTGALHQFEESGVVQGTDFIATHHSSPLAGGDVAGAGKIKIDDDRIVGISDQSGHYKPGAQFTFQTVRQINMATLSDGIKAKLKKRPSAEGQPEGSDTMQQLVAAEVGAERERYFAELDKAEEDLNAQAAALPTQEAQDAAFEQIAQARREKVEGFRKIAAKVEAELRKGDAQSPLIDPTEVDDSDDDDEEDLHPGNTQAKISLLGKAGMLSEAEYAEVIKRAGDAPTSIRDGIFKEEFNKASALKQLQAPMGEEAFAALLKSGGIERALEAHGLVPGAKGAADQLKAFLGKEAVDKIKGDDDAIQALSAKYKVVSIDRGYDHGVEGSGFEVGKATAASLRSEQFLQTGGNEAQIRNKQRLVNEIQPNKDKPGKRPELKPQPDSPMHQELGESARAEARRTELNDEAEEIGGRLIQLEADIEQFLDGGENYRGDLEEAQKQFDALAKKKQDIAAELTTLREGDDPNAARKSEIEDELDEIEQELNQLVLNVEYWESTGVYKAELAEAAVKMKELDQQKAALDSERGSLA